MARQQNRSKRAADSREARREPQRSGSDGLKTKKPAPGDATAGRPFFGFGPANLAAFLGAIAAIITGYVLLDRGSVTAAPILLILGYVVLLPVAVLLGWRKLGPPPGE